MNHQHTVLRTAQILTRDETAKKCRRGNIVVYWPTLYFFQYLFWLNFPVFFKFSFLVFWQSSKKKSTIGKLPQYLGWRKSLAFFQRCTITLTSMHNNQDSNCVAYPPIFTWCWRTQKIQRFSSNNYTWPIHERINVLKPKWKTVMFIYWTSIYFIHHMEQVFLENAKTGYSFLLISALYRKQWHRPTGFHII